MNTQHVEVAKTFAILLGMVLCVCGLLTIAAIAICDALRIPLFI